MSGLLSRARMWGGDGALAMHTSKSAVEILGQPAEGQVERRAPPNQNPISMARSRA